MKTLFELSTRDVKALNRKEFSIKRTLSRRRYLLKCRERKRREILENRFRSQYWICISASDEWRAEKRGVAYGQLEFESFVALIGDRKVKSENSARANAVDCVHGASFIHKNAREAKKTVRFSETHADREILRGARQTQQSSQETELIWHKDGAGCAKGNNSKRMSSQHVFSRSTAAGLSMCVRSSSCELKSAHLLVDDRLLATPDACVDA